MKKILLAALCLFSLGTLVQAQDVTPEMKTVFLNKVKADVAQKDFKAFSLLYSQSGTVDLAMKDELNKFYQDIFNILSAIPSPDYKFAGSTPNQPASFKHNGKTYEPNLKLLPHYNFTIRTGPRIPLPQGHGAFRFPLGIENGALMIVQTVLKP